MPTSTTPVSRPLASELSVPAGKTYYYNLDITLNNLDDVDQTSDLSAQFTTEFNVGQPKKYRYYTLKVAVSPKPNFAFIPLSPSENVRAIFPIAKFDLKGYKYANFCYSSI